MLKIIYIFGLGLISACTYSTGERTGMVNKFSKKGFILKTYEGEMQMGLGAQNVFKFTVEGDALVSEVEQANRSGKQVTLVYDQKFSVCKLGTSDTCYFIKSVLK